MTTLLTRAQWGARAAVGTGNSLNATPDGAVIHWEGPKMGSRPHSQCGAIVRGIQAFHMGPQRGWADIAYNLLVCEHGVIFEGRGRGKGSAANGTTDSNRRFYAICALVGQGDAQPAALIQGLKDAVALVRSWGAKNAVLGHRDTNTTSCPGDALYAQVKRGTFGTGTAPTTSKPKPPASSIPAVGKKAPAFPLPRGWYFGPSTGPKASVSGYYGHRADLKRWQAEMADRGWAIDVDGLYGPNTRKVALAFQDEKGLDRDGLIGVETWAAAWTAPRT